MGVKYSIVFQLLLLVVSLIYSTNAQFFDITKYGAAPGSPNDASWAISSAWKDACASASHSHILIPSGTFYVKQLLIQGPCRAPITIQLQGTLKAPIDVSIMDKLNDWISIRNTDHLTIYGGGTLDGQGAATWAAKMAKKIDFVQPTSLGLDFLTNAWIEGITSMNSKMFHINVLGGRNVTLHHVTIKAPGDSPNTDGVHIGRATDVRVIDCPISTGDDCVSIGDGTQQVRIEKVYCGPGHGIAIGSLGKYPNELPVRGIYVIGCTLTKTWSGLRIKTWENSPVGEASDIHFQDIIVNDANNPIIIDQEYCPAANCPAVEPPSRVKISKVSFKGIRGTSATKEAVKLVCSKSFPCEIEFGDIDLKYNGPDGPATSTCANVWSYFTGRQTPSVCVARGRSQDL